MCAKQVVSCQAVQKCSSGQSKLQSLQEVENGSARNSGGVQTLAMRGRPGANDLRSLAMFGRPRHEGPTRHLFVGNCGPCVGQSEQQVSDIFSPFGEVHVTVPGEAKPHVFVSFKDAVAASKAMANLGSPSEDQCTIAGNRSLVLKYADFKKEKVCDANYVWINYSILWLHISCLYLDFESDVIFSCT